MAIQTFGEMLAALYIDLKNGASPDAAVVTRYKRLLNEAERKILRASNQTLLREVELPLTSVVSQKTYGLPAAFDGSITTVQPSVGDRLVMRTQTWLKNTDPQETATGNPYVWIPEGLQAVARHPVATGVWAASSNAADTTQAVRVTAIRTNGSIPAQLTATLTGTTRVQIGSLTDLNAILRFGLSATAVGDVTLYDAAVSGNTLAVLGRGSVASRFAGIRLWPTPGTALDYVIRGTVAMPPMVDDNDIPRVPAEYADALPTYVRMREYKTNRADVERFSMEREEWERVLQEIKASSQFPDDYRPVAGHAGEKGIRWSNLGGAFPPDGWGW